MSACPLLTVGIPAYNRVSFLRRCLESVLSQSAGNIEVIVSDDSTSAEPGALAQRLLHESSIPSRYVRNTPAKGMAANWNACVELARGRYVLVLHDDDLLYPHAASRILSACARHAWNVGLFDVAVVNEQGRRIRPRRPHRSRYLPPADALASVLSNSSFVRFPGMVVTKSAYATVGLFDEDIGPAADLEMWIRLVERYGLWRFRGLTASYRVHPAALTASMWTNDVVHTIAQLFADVASRHPLPAPELERCRADWFHRFVLAGAVRELRNGRPDRAREVLRLFESPELSDLQSPPAWRFLRASLSLALDGRRSQGKPGAG